MDETTMRETGFAKLEAAIDDEVAREVDAALDALLEAPAGDDHFGLDLSRLKYDPDIDASLVLDRVLTPALRARLSALVERELFLAQVIGFEIQAGESRGFDWHVGHGSFAYQRIEDYAATLWIPLSPVDTRGQHGGMAYVPRDRLSGEFLYQIHRSSIAYFRDSFMERIGEPGGYEALVKEHKHLTGFSAYTDFLEFNRVEHDFAAGDALFFDKYVLHRTAPLLPGALARRRALVLRFIDTGSRFCEVGARIHQLATSAVGAGSASALPSRLGLGDGELLLTSPAFGALRRRVLRAA